MLLQTTNNRWCSATLALCCLLFIVLPRCEAQNLVPNPSFELVDTCPHTNPLLGYLPNARPQGWFSASGTPDYFNACVDTVAGVPLNYLSFQHAAEGSAYSGLFTYASHALEREMVSTELTTPLMVGHTYYASFYANAAIGGEQIWLDRATNNIGLLFTTDSSEWFNNMPLYHIGNFAHVHSTDVVNDTVGWTLVSGSFVADSAYHYVVVGNHFDDQNTIIDSLVPDTNLTHKAYVLVDALCVSLDPNGCPLANSVTEQFGYDLTVFPNPATDELFIKRPGDGTGTLQVTDALGRVVWMDQSVVREIRVPVTTWPRGCYLLTEQGEGSNRSFKFVLM